MLLIRRIDDQNAETKLINYREVLKHYEANEDIDIQAGDMLFVPQTLITRISPVHQARQCRFLLQPSQSVDIHFRTEVASGAVAADAEGLDHLALRAKELAST